MGETTHYITRGTRWYQRVTTILALAKTDEPHEFASENEVYLDDVPLSQISNKGIGELMKVIPDRHQLFYSLLEELFDRRLNQIEHLVDMNNRLEKRNTELEAEIARLRQQT